MCSLTIGKELLRGFGGKAWELGNGLLASAQVFFFISFFFFYTAKETYQMAKRDLLRCRRPPRKCSGFFVCLFGMQFGLVLFGYDIK